MSRLTDVAVEHLREIVLQPTPVASGRRYEIGQIIGEGGMGVVYLAHDRELDRDVALKVLRNPIPTGEERERLLHEARILASLEHPGIVPVHDVGTLSDGRVFYVMKHVRGDRLDEFARANRSRAELLRVFLQVCDAVAFAHAAGIVHRDLKPQNVMLGAFGEVLVLDWGIAKSGAARPAVRRHGTGDLPNTSRAERTMGSAVIGTPGYMAPEQLAGTADERVDVHGLGGILFFLLTREHPTANAGATESADALRDVPAPLRAVCERARADDPSLRYQTVAALEGDVANYLGSLPVTAHKETIVERVRRVGARHRTALLLVAAYLLMRVALLIFARR